MCESESERERERERKREVKEKMVGERVRERKGMRERKGGPPRRETPVITIALGKGKASLFA